MESDNTTKTSLSAGEIIRALLLMDEGVTAITSRVFPLISDKALLPYICYRRTQMEPTPVKGRPHKDKILMELECCASSYVTSVQLAEAVRGCLDGTEATHGDLVMNSCILADASEDYEDEAFIQTLIFEVRITGMKATQQHTQN